MENTQIIYCYPGSNLCLLLKKKMLESIKAPDSPRPSCLSENQAMREKLTQAMCQKLWRSSGWGVREKGSIWSQRSTSITGNSYLSPTLHFYILPATHNLEKRKQS